MGFFGVSIKLFGGYWTVSSIKNLRLKQCLGCDWRYQFSIFLNSLCYSALLLNLLYHFWRRKLWFVGCSYGSKERETGFGLTHYGSRTIPDLWGLPSSFGDLRAAWFPLDHVSSWLPSLDLLWTLLYWLTFPAWPWSCVIIVDLAKDLDYHWSLITTSRALLFLLRFCGILPWLLLLTVFLLSSPGPVSLAKQPACSAFCPSAWISF